MIVHVHHRFIWKIILYFNPTYRKWPFGTSVTFLVQKQTQSQWQIIFILPQWVDCWVPCLWVAVSLSKWMFLLVTPVLFSQFPCHLRLFCFLEGSVLSNGVLHPVQYHLMISEPPAVMCQYWILAPIVDMKLGINAHIYTLHVSGPQSPGHGPESLGTGPW